MQNLRRKPVHSSVNAVPSLHANAAPSLRADLNIGAMHTDPS